ncbi:hypothetical protein Franean1_7178 [Parafrankia sp. EAN1pec]|uniref:hypothetical protein n=1 Tax=Parafrankia sp. (strain EAN1pec) TaxID=298653 RepID=UPI0000541DED|nr:hypothetical protein Franean1_7178 [Frankia sp. EAN1pec]
MAGGKRGRSGLRQAFDQLNKLDRQSLSPERWDTVVELRDVLEQIERLQAGEFRIVAAGAMASMKSTMLELLLGRPDTLLVGAGAVTAVPTLLRLVQAEDGRPGRTRVTMLTEAAALRRARALLDLDHADARALGELAALDHPNRHVVGALARAAQTFEYGVSYELKEFLALGGELSIGGFGVPLLARVIVDDVPVPASVWDLSWAGGRTVVVTDLPGTGQGRALENLVRAEHQAVTHVSLNVVAFSGGSDFEPPPVQAEPDCVLVATKLDRIENPADPNELRAVEEAVAATLRQWRLSGRQALVAAVSGTWAFADETGWLDFDPRSPAGAWGSAQDSRRVWADAAWDPHGPTEGQLRQAVAAAMLDGGAKRLRAQIAGLATDAPARVDEAELDRLVTQARRLVTAALTDAGDPREEEDKVDRLRNLFDGDQEPVDALREIARTAAATAVYGLPAWDVIRNSAFRRDGVWRGSMPQVRGVLAAVDLAGIATDAITEAEDELADRLASWSGTFGITADGRGRSPAAADTDHGAAEQFAALGGRLLRLLTDNRARGGPADTSGGPADAPGGRDFGSGDGQSERLSFRLVARTRAELAMLLEHRLVDLLGPMVDEARADVRAELHRRSVALSHVGGAPPALRAVERELRRLAAAGTGSAR